MNNDLPCVIHKDVAYGILTPFDVVAIRESMSDALFNQTLT